MLMHIHYGICVGGTLLETAQLSLNVNFELPNLLFQKNVGALKKNSFWMATLLIANLNR
jgi:hypothetical protein